MRRRRNDARRRGGLSLLGTVVFALASRDDDPVWNAIPSGQYAGRNAESGGIARAEQERALEELQAGED